MREEPQPAFLAAISVPDVPSSSRMLLGPPFKEY
jgi:hypothetical protein